MGMEYLIKHEHDRFDDIEFIDDEVVEILDVTLKYTLDSLLEGYVPVAGGNIAKTKTYTGEGSAFVTLWFLHNIYVEIEPNGTSYKYRLYDDSKKYTDQSPIRRGKLSKALALLKLSQEDIKSIMTKEKAGTRSYTICKTNMIYNHYRQMDRRGVVSTCMSKVPVRYSVSLDTSIGTKNYNPIIAYEVGEDWTCLLLRDNTIKKGEYRYVARAISHQCDSLYSYNRIHGQSTVFQSLLYDNDDVFEEKSFDGFYLPRLDTTDYKVVFPYIDSGNEATIHKHSVEIGGELEGDHSTGVIKDGWYCKYCDVYHDHDVEILEFEEENYCEEAINSVFVIGDDGEYLWAEDSVYCVDGEHRHIDNVVYCETDEDYYDAYDNDLIEIEGHYYLKSDEDVAETDTGEYFLISENISDDFMYDEVTSTYMERDDYLELIAQREEEEEDDLCDEDTP